MRDLDTLRSEVACELAAGRQSLPSVKASNRQVHDGDADRAVAFSNRSVHVEADDSQVESPWIEALGGANRVQLRSAKPHAVEHERDTNSLPAAAVGGSRFKHWGRCLDDAAVARIVHRTQVRRFGTGLTSAKPESSLVGVRVHVGRVTAAVEYNLPLCTCPSPR